MTFSTLALALDITLCATFVAMVFGVLSMAAYDVPMLVRARRGALPALRQV